VISGINPTTTLPATAASAAGQTRAAARGAVWATGPRVLAVEAVVFVADQDDNWPPGALGLLKGGRDARRIGIAFAEADKTKRPVVVLVGDEYHGFNR